MAEANIYIDGVIGNPDMQGIDIWGESKLVSLKDVREQLEAQTTEPIIVNINSPGGDVDTGFAIYDYLKTCGKEVDTKIVGLCGSVATVINSAGKKRGMTDNSDFHIHNPYMDGVTGDADELAAYAASTQKTETKFKEFYSNLTGMDVKDLDVLMKVSTSMTAEQALAFGFITEIITGEDAETEKALAKVIKLEAKADKPLRAVAFIKSKDMTFKGILASIKAKTGTTKAKTYTLESGETIETNADTDVEVGNIVTDAEGALLAAGDYILKDGRTMVIGDEGIVGEVKEVEAPEENAETKEALGVLLSAVEDIQTKMAAIEKTSAANQLALKSLGNNDDPEKKKANISARVRNLKPGDKKGVDIQAARAAHSENHKRKVKN